MLNKILAAIQDFFLIQDAKWSANRAVQQGTAQEILSHALTIEEKEPQEAWKKFKEVRRKNTVSFPSLRTAAFALPFISTLLSYFSIKWLQLEDSLWSYVIWFAVQFLLAYYPVTLLYFDKAKGARMLYSKDNPSKTSLTLGTFLFMMNDVLAVVGVLLFGFIFTLPITALLQWGVKAMGLTDSPWGHNVDYFSIVLIVLVGASFHLTNLPFTNYIFTSADYSGLTPSQKRAWWRRSLSSMLRQILAGWAFNFGLIVQTLMNLAYYFWTIRMAGLISQIPLTECIISGLLAGVMVGFSFKRLDDNPLIEQMAILGEVRCMFRLGKVYGAQERIWWVEGVSTINLLKALAGALDYLKLYKEKGWPGLIPSFNLQRAKEVVDALAIEKWPYSDLYHTIDSLWDGTLRNSRRLILGSMLSEGMILPDHPGLAE